MSENNNEPAPEGTAGGDADIMRAIVTEGGEDFRSAAKRVRDAMNRANDANANRVTGIQSRRLTPEEMDRTLRHAPFAVDRDPIPPPRVGPDPADPSKPVVGILDMIEEVVANTQRYGAFAHWPGEKKSEVLGLVTRTVKQHAIAEQVTVVVRRDSVHARAYRERRRLAREAATLVRTYFRFGSVSGEQVSNDMALYTEALNYLGRFAQKVESLPEVPGEESEAPE